MRHDPIAQIFGHSPLFVDRAGFRAWTAKAELKAAALATHDAMQAAMTAYAQRQTGPQMLGDVAVIEVDGPITYKSSWLSLYFGIASIQDLQQQFRMALGDPAVKTIAFKCDSPGGCVDMCPEFADEIFAARGQKPLVAVADTLVASAAYWLMSQVDTIYASVSSQLGSIGVYCEHDDISAMLDKAGIKVTLIAHGDNKVDGNPYEPLSDTARAEMQASVDEIGDWFDTAVARGRGVKKSAVLETFGQGKVFRGKEAIGLGLADKAGTFSQVLGKLTKGRVGMAARAEGGPIPIQASEPNDDEQDGCEQCDPECPCEEPECGPECKTCAETCACYKAKAKADADAATADEQSIVAAMPPAQV